MNGRNPRSTAKFAGHPIHPMLVTLPIASFIGALGTDLGFRITGELGWATASNWLLGFGLVTALFAAAAGLTDYMGDNRHRRIGAATRHMIANVTGIVIETINLLVRIRSSLPMEATPFPNSACGCRSPQCSCLAILTGWAENSSTAIGSELGFRPTRHRLPIPGLARPQPTSRATVGARPARPSVRRPGRSFPTGTGRPRPCARNDRRPPSGNKLAC